MINIYSGLQVESPEPVMIPIIKLRARIVDDTHFIFVPEFWEEALKPYRRAKWDYEKAHREYGISDIGYIVPTQKYSIKAGDYLVFRDLLPLMDGGFYAAHLYMVVKEMQEGQVHVTVERDRFNLELKVEGRIVQRVVLKTQAIKMGDEIFHALLKW